MLRSRSVFQPVLEWSRNPRIQMDRTLAVLGEYGVTEATIRMHCQPPQANIIWGETEKATLVYLITGYHPLIPVLPQSKRLVPVLALKEMSKLNYHQLNALLYLYSKGLRGDALRQWRDDRGTNNFSYLHYVALKELINYSGLTSSAAMEKIQGLSADAAEDLQLSARRALVWPSIFAPSVKIEIYYPKSLLVVWMYKPLPLYIGLRYMRAKKKSHFVSFISLSSMLGIALGVMVLITVLSVMNGFHDQIYTNFFGMAPEISVTGQNGSIENWESVAQQIETFPRVKGLSPYAEEIGLLTFDSHVAPVMVTGILPEAEQQINHLKDRIVLGSMDDLAHFGMVIGWGLSEKLGVMIGDKVTVMIPEMNVSPTGTSPRFKRFTIVGIFSAGSGFGFDKNIAFIHMQDAQKLMHLDSAITGLKVRIDSIYQAPVLAEKLGLKLGKAYQVSNWTQQYGAFFQAVGMEKTMMFFVLVLIIAVAAFNLVSSLVMIVTDKQAEIAILRTIGATPRTILSIFMVQGMMVGLWGTLLGLIGGVILATYAPAIVHFFQQFFNIPLFAFNLYGSNWLPSKILWNDLWQVCLLALFLSFIATIYPALRASKTMIAEALHYE